MAASASYPVFVRKTHENASFRRTVRLGVGCQASLKREREKERGRERERERERETNTQTVTYLCNRFLVHT